MAKFLTSIRTHGWVMLWGLLAAYMFVTKGKDEPIVLVVVLYAFVKWEIADLRAALKGEPQ